MKLIFRLEEYREMEFNFQNYSFCRCRCRCQTRYFTVMTGDLANKRSS